MANHADAVREAERAVVEAAVEWRPLGTVTANIENGRKLAAAVDALLALRAETCPTCGGTGGAGVTVETPFGLAEVEGWRPCPAGCERGKRRTT